MEANKKQRDALIGVFCTLGSEVLWGLSFIFTKATVDSVGVLPLLGWRFVIAFAAMAVMVLVGAAKIRLRGKSLKTMALIVICCPIIYFIGENFGVLYTTSLESGVLIAVIPAVSLSMSAIVLKKMPTRYQLLGILIALVGVLITVFAVGGSSSFSVIGYVFLLAAVIAYAFYSVLVERSTQYSSTEITFVMQLVGAVVFAALAFASLKVPALSAGAASLGETAVSTAASGTSGAAGATRDAMWLLTLPFRDRSFLITVLYQGIGCSVGAFFLMNIAISKIGVNRTSSFVGVTTVVSILAGAIVLREPFTLYQIIGAAVILLGVYTANAKKIS